MIEYCIKGLGYSESAAYRRKSALRLQKKVKTVIKKIESGEISLSQATKINSAFEEKEKQQGKRLTFNEKSKIIEKVKGLPSIETEKEVRDYLQLPTKRRTITIEVTDETYNRWIEFKSINAAKRLDDEQLLSKAIEAATTKKVIHKKRKAQPQGSKNNRYIPMNLRRKLLEKALHKCQYPKCDSKYSLEIDHIMPLSKGGKTEESNLQVLCRNHNQLKSNKLSI